MNPKCLWPFRFNLRKSLADPFIRFCVKFETLKDHQKQTIQGKLKFSQLFEVRD